MPDDDFPHAALETDAATIDGFVQEENARTKAAFMGAAFEGDAARVAAILENPDRIGGLSRRGDWLYTFKQTAKNPRGLWLRRPQDAPIEANTGWQTVFDVDAFCAETGGDWHWRGAATAHFDPGHVLLQLSQGGSDQTRLIEFHCDTGIALGGFDLAPSRSSANWLDRDTLIWSSAAEGDAADTSWPGTVRLLRRDGSAQEIFRVQPGDLRAYGYSLPTAEGGRLVAVSRGVAIGQAETILMLPDGPLVLPAPPDTTVSASASHYAYEIKEQGGTPGALMLGKIGEAAQEVWAPKDRQAIQGAFLLQDWLVWEVRSNMAPELWVLSLTDPNAQPVQIQPPEPADVFFVGLHDAGFGPEAGTAASPLVMHIQGFLRSPVSYLFDLDQGPEGVRYTKLWAEPEMFDASGKTVELREAVSDDGTRVPYHLVRPETDGPVPTLIYGYGGFGVSMGPGYSPVNGTLWLERGGAYVMAYIRGGAEFGPDWHLQAKGAGRVKAFQDFAAIARDLAEAGLATPAQIGCHGGSNGGLLTGVMLNRYPDRFGAIWSAVGVYDMLRFHKFPAGRAWMDEYGDPDRVEDRAWLKAYSPIHTAPDGDLPPALITTSDNDDRVDPSHARRYAAALQENGHAPWFYQHGGGHGGGGSSRARAAEQALGYGFLAKTLGLET